MLTTLPVHPAEIVSVAATNVGFARWQVDIVFTPNPPNDVVPRVVSLPDIGGQRCPRLNTDLAGNRVKLRQICRGVPYGTGYYNVYLRTVDGGRPQPVTLISQE